MKTYGIPFLLWAAAAVGLVVMLAADGLADVASLFLVAAPLVAVGARIFQVTYRRSTH